MDDRGPKPCPVHEFPENFSLRDPGKVRTRLAQPYPFKYDRSDRESVSDEVVQFHCPNDKIAAQVFRSSIGAAQDVEALDLSMRFLHR